MSTSSSNLFQAEGVLVDSSLLGGVLRVNMDSFEVAATDLDQQDIIRFCRIPAGARSPKFTLWHDSMASVVIDINIGLHRRADPGPVIGALHEDTSFAKRYPGVPEEISSLGQDMRRLADGAASPLDIDSIPDRMYTVKTDSDNSEGQYDIVGVINSAVPLGGTMSFAFFFVTD